MKILIACGGTGGHIFPGLSLYNSLKKRQNPKDILLVLDKRAISSSVISGQYPYVCLSLAPIRFKFDLQSATIVLELIRGILETLRLVLRFRPDVVVGFGGYASFLPVFFASLFRKKTVIHEQNVSFGLANRILANFVDKIAISFPRTGNYCSGKSLKIFSDKLKFTGNPLRQDLVRIEKARARECLGLSEDKFTILVMGGSQGARNINTTFIKAVGLIKNKRDVQVIHLCGESDRRFLEIGYKDLEVKAGIFSFFNSMGYAYSAADIVVSRAGATTISEIAFFGLPAILIPYPYARGHQVENAYYLRGNNAAVLIEEEYLNSGILEDKILELFNSPGKRNLMSQNISGLSSPDAGESLADLVLR